MRITIVESDNAEKKYLEEKLKKNKSAKLRFISGELNKESLSKIKDTEALILFVNSRVDSTVLEALPKLKFVATKSTGFDHIDVKSCKERGIKVSNVPFYGENTVAEHAFGLILCLSQKLYEGIERTRKDNFSLDGLEGFDLKDKTLGVIGAGHIGQHVIRMALGFQMKVIAYSPKKYQDSKIAKKIGFRYVSLDNLLENSDVITVHAPLTAETKHMINMKNIRKIKRGSYLVNTARGAIIDTQALKYALDRGILGGAALDVLEGEEDIREESELLKKDLEGDRLKDFLTNHLLLKKENVLVTPHSAFYSREAVNRIRDETVENIKAFLKGKVKNKVN